MAELDNPTAMPLLLGMPDPCLLAVLRGCADDPASLFNAARAHSRLYEAAVLALSNIAVDSMTQEQVDGLLLYLHKHGQHVRSISLGAPMARGLGPDARVHLRRLPTNMQLHSLQLSKLHLQLQPDDDFLGVLGAADSMPLKQLQLSECRLLDGPEGLAATLSLLPKLEHLSLSRTSSSDWQVLRVPPIVWEDLQQLTYLELAHVFLQEPAGGSASLPSLQHLTGLVDLRLAPLDSLAPMESDWLPGCLRLTRLVLSPDFYRGCLVLHPDVLAGQTQLQHLEVRGCSISGGSAGCAQLLSGLQSLQQLTHLSWTNGFKGLHGSLPPVVLPLVVPAAAFSALTASSRLQHLGLDYCMLPAGVWQHLFPAGRQLQHLTSLDVIGVQDYNRKFAEAPAGARLSSCCPGLQSLNIRHLCCSAEQLAPLRGLSRLHTLVVGPPRHSSVQGLEAVGRLAALRQLTMFAPESAADGLLLELARLKHLNSLEYSGPLNGSRGYMKWQAADDEPVWRQLLQHHLDNNDPELAQQAAAALLAE